MEAFSSLLLELYRQTQIVPPTEFQARALDAIQEKLAFDSALWATGTIGPDGATPHSIFVYRQPPDMMENWGRIKPRDTLIYEAFNSLGRTINGALSTDPFWQERFNADMMVHIKHYGLEHTLITMIATPLLRLYTAVSFFRADPGQPFTEADRLFKQNLMPHLAEAWNLNRFNFLHPSQENNMHAGRARAICDKEGVVYNISQSFEGLMLAEWPGWRGPQLPGAMLDILSGTSRRQYSGHAIVGTIKPLNDMILLNVRRKSTVDQLSPRELEVAKRFGQGMNYRKIADELHIAPSTVRNHLQAIYASLGVNSKTEMARIVREAEH